MKFSVLGATGPSGVQFVIEAIENEHEVIALVRNPSKLSDIKSDKLQVKVVDIFKEEDLVEEFKNTDVVVSCLGSKISLFGWSTISFYLDSMKVIVAALRSAGRKRLICLTSWYTVPQPDEPFMIKYFVKPVFLCSVLRSMEVMENYLKESCSDINFTVVRPPGLNDNPSSVLGATGPSGVQFVIEAIENEHEVIALVRNPSKLSDIKSDKLQVKVVDIFKEEDLVEEFKNTDVVVSCLGSKISLFGWSTISFYLDSMKVIVAALRSAGRKRLICLTSWYTVPQPDEPFMIKYFVKPVFLCSVLRSMEVMENYLKESCNDINFTVVRPPGLNDNPSSGKNFRALENAYSVPDIDNRMPRRDVGKFLLKCAIRHEWIQRFVAIGLEN